MTTTVSPKQAKSLLIDAIKAKLVLFIEGSPGTAKSSIVKQVAKEFNLELIDERLAQADPTDYKGMPTTYVDEHGIKRAGFLPFDQFPIKGQPLPQGKDGWLLFLDEFNSAPLSVQAACYKLTLDRQIGGQDLHERCIIVLAGNLASDNAIVNRMSTAMQSRLLHLTVEPNAKEWLEWANNNGIDHRVTSFVEFKPNLLMNFNPDHEDKTFPCP